jgi:dTDP-4-amino-4,6-dideoxygalactose transaminase
LALLALEIGPGDEVLVPSLTFAATANVIKYVGAKPVFCDVISHSNLTIDPNEIEQKITKKSKAIIVMHYAGFPCDMDEIVLLAKKHKLFVIEDSAHAPLSEYKGNKVGTLGDIGTFSFFSNKNIAIGEGGMIITNNKKLHEKFKLIRSHGMTSLSYQRFKGHATKYDIKSLGYNYRMDDIRASIGIVQLKKLNQDIIKRSELRKLYIDKLKNNSKIIIPFENNENFVSNYIFPIVLNNVNREEIRDRLDKKSIQTSIHYPSIHRFSVYEKDYLELPNTDYISKNEMTLPLYSNLKGEDIDYVTNSLLEILEQNHEE